MTEEEINQIVEAAGSGEIQIKSSERKARKLWCCKECGKEIPAGEVYWNRTIGVTGNHVPILSEHYCLSCQPGRVLMRILERQRGYLRILN